MKKPPPYRYAERFMILRGGRVRCTRARFWARRLDHLVNEVMYRQHACAIYHRTAHKGWENSWHPLFPYETR